MRKLFSLTIILLTTVFSIQNVVASPDEHGDEERKSVKHYDVAEPGAKEEALKMINENLTSSQEAVKKEDWHNVHVNSYNIEAATLALKKLSQDEILKEDLQAFWAINEEVHIASESDEIKPETVRQEFQKLKETWQTLSQRLVSNSIFSKHSSKNDEEAENKPSKLLENTIADLEKLLEQKTWAPSKVKTRELVKIIRTLDDDNPEADVQRALILATGNLTDNIKHKRYSWATTTLGKVKTALAIEQKTENSTD